MKISQIEAWVLEVADRVVRGHPVEDARVELKRAWVDPDKAARAIAGHANSSFGEPVLWVVGLDESEGAIGVKPEDLSDWWAQVKSCFSELAPDVTPLTVPCRDVVLTALLFDTSRAPFIVKNPVFGRREGGPVQLEVPWRESTAVRSARRADLLRVLVPAQSLPDVEVLAGYAAATNQFSGGKYEREWEVRILVYLVPRSEHRLTIPFHRCRVRMTADPEFPNSELGRLSIGGYTSLWEGPEQTSLTIQGTGGELVVEGPGVARLYARGRVPCLGFPLSKSLSVEASLGITGVGRNVELHCELRQGTDGKFALHKAEVLVP